MLSIQADATELQSAGAYGHRSGSSPNDVSLFIPPRLVVALDDLLDGIRERRARAYFDEHRPGIASLILLAHHMGVVSEGEIDRAVSDGWRDFYRLHCEALSRIAAHLEAQARALAGSDWPHGDFESIGMALDRFEGEFWLLLWAGFRFTQVSLCELPRELGRMVYGCLHWIANRLGFGLLAQDALDMWFGLEEELEAYEEYRKEHPHKDHRQFAREALATHLLPFCEFTDNIEDLVCRLDFLQSVLDERADLWWGNPPDMDEIRKAVIEWWRGSSDLYCHPWIGFIKKTVLVFKRHRRLNTATSESIADIAAECDDTEVPLDYAHMIGFDLPWEGGVADDFYNQLYQTGETPVLRLKLHPVAISKVAEKLESIAQARGLLRLAEVIERSL